MGILMLMMVITIYDAYEVTSIYEGLKIDGEILDHKKFGLKKKISHYHVDKLNKNRIPPPKVEENEFLPIGFTIRNLPSLEERFHALERESDMSKLLKWKKNYMLIVLARSITIDGVVGMVGYGLFCGFD
ncbi:hypothetical protein LIER_27057 [Lithospermum erythrorhizon]|uniref:Uncharacterized protein n=1 Tax=Lithospermum erythrorhizon TaxID=34254 RepID=A0AAV3RAQ2_LITER